MLAIACLASGSPAQAQFEQAFLRPYPERYLLIDSVLEVAAEDSIGSSLFSRYGAPSRALRIAAIRHKDPTAVLLADMYVLISSHLTDSTAVLRQSDHAVQELLRRARTLGAMPIEAKIYYHMSDQLFDARQYQASFMANFVAYDLYERMTPVEFPDKAYALYTLGLYYYQFGDYERAIHYARKSLRTRFGPYSRLAMPWNLYNILSMAFLKSKRYDSADTYMTMAYRAAVRHKWHKPRMPPRKVAISIGNIGVSYMEQGKYDQAVPYLLRGANLSTRYGVWDNAAVFLSRLIAIYEKQGRWTEAGALLAEARAASDSARTEESWQRLYEVLRDDACHRREYRLAIAYQDSVSYWKDSLKTRLDANQLRLAELRYAEATYLRRSEAFRRAHAWQEAVRNGLLVLIAASAAAAMVISRRRQAANERLRQELEAKAGAAEKALLYAQEEFRDFTRRLSVKRDEVEYLEKQQQPSAPVADPGQAARLEDLRNSVIITEEGWEDFRRRFEAVYPGCIHALRERHPDYTAAELRVLVLDKLQLNTKEMAAMLGVSPVTIRVTRSRMRKKDAEQAEHQRPGARA